LSAQAESMKEVVAQLVALVGGAGSQKVRGKEPTTGRAGRRRSIEHGLRAAEKRGAKPRTFGKSDETFHKIAVHSGKSERTTGVLAAEALPPDDNEDLSGFNG